MTDHCDLHLSTDLSMTDHILNCHKKIDQLNESNTADITILKGIEIGEGIWYPQLAKEITKDLYFDVILFSVHAVRNKISCIPYSQINFSEWTTEQLNSYMSDYFDDIICMIETFDFDILTHLTNPLKYVPNQKSINLELFNEKIDKILNSIIKKDISLEINTASYSDRFPQFTPDIEILKRYKKMGGNSITLGSDAHIANNASKDFKYAVNILKQIGFNYCVYYKNREKNKYGI